MTTPLEIWKKAKETFTAAVKNNKNTRKPGSWFTSGTESAIKDVMAIEYHSDIKQLPQTWMKGSTALNDKLREKYKQEKKKLHADKEKILKTLAGVLQKKNLPEEDISRRSRRKNNTSKNSSGTSWPCARRNLSSKCEKSGRKKKSSTPSTSSTRASASTPP